MKPEEYLYVDVLELEKMVSETTVDRIKVSFYNVDPRVSW
jgi:hypothetical protein